MKILVCLLLLCVPALAEKMHVKVIDHHIGETGYTKFVPGMSFGNGNASSNCGASGNCSGSASHSSIYAPAHEVQVSLDDIEMTLLLPDGRKVIVGCQDHFWGLAKGNRHNCKNPMGDEMEANFSGKKVKLTWPVGIDGKKKESETFIISQILPAPKR